MQKLKKWQEFELNTVKYLEGQYGNDSIKFMYEGSSDSTKTDILVMHNNVNIFNIECKYYKSQSSQFVVFENDKDKFFYFSPDNKSLESDALPIIKHLNDNFDYYSKKTNSAKGNTPLICENKLMSDYIIKNMKTKASVIISSDFIDNFNLQRPLTITSVADIADYYKVTGIYRPKKSGTRHTIQKHLTNFQHKAEMINDRFYVYDPNKKLDDYQDNKKLFLSKDIVMNGYRAIKKRSNTNSRTIIFSLELKDDVKVHTSKDFLNNIIAQSK
jgi:hypothetical protein